MELKYNPGKPGSAFEPGAHRRRAATPKTTWRPWRAARGLMNHEHP